LTQASHLYQTVKGKDRSQTFFSHTNRAVGYAIQCLGDKDLSEYTTSHAGEFRDWLFAKELKRPSVSRNLGILKAVINLCIQEKGLDLINPFANVYIPHNECQTKRHSLTNEQLSLLQRNCRDRDDSLRWLAALISDTGMRLAEAVGLASDDLKLDDDIPYVTIQKKRWRPLKTYGSERAIPLVGASLWAAQRLSSNAAGQFLFPQYVTGKFTNANSASAALNKWIKTFLPQNCVVHGMRHAFRDRLRAADMPLDMIDQIGGWSTKSVGTTYGKGYDLGKISSILSQIALDYMSNERSTYPAIAGRANREDSV
jgi:integrase